MSQKGQRVHADRAAKKGPHIALETIVNMLLVTSVETMSLLAVIVVVITAQAGQHLTSSDLLTAEALLNSLSLDLQGRCLTADQIIQNSIEQAGKGLISAAEGEAASVIEVALAGVAFHLVGAEAGVTLMVLVLKHSTRSANIKHCCGIITYSLLQSARFDRLKQPHCSICGCKKAAAWRPAS